MSLRRGLVAALMVAGAAQAEPLALKGYVPGAEMAQCPADVVKVTPGKVGEVMCRMPAGTVGGSDYAALVLTLRAGRLVDATFILRERGLAAHRGLYAALRERHGWPTESKSHLNEYTWRQRPHELHLDGWRGLLVVADELAAARLLADQAKADKSDL